MFQNWRIGAFIAVNILVATFVFYAWQVLRTPNLQADEGDAEFGLLVPAGSTFESVMDTLKAHRVLTDVTSFRFLAKLMKYPERVKKGYYLIRPNANNYETIGKLRSGAQDPMKMTFSSVRVKADLIQRVGARFEFGPDSLRKRLDDERVCRKYGFDTTTIVCLFLPNTYEFFWTIKPDAFLDRMAGEYKKFWTADRKAKAAALDLSQTQVQVLASIVAAETNKRDEQPRVAGVYLNRLRQGIKLEADPTVIFALRDFGIRRLLTRQLAVESPYNTYRNTGLPPGPINLPAPATIDAVLNAERHEYLFFVVDARFTGYHTFSKTLAEHMANARLYQKALTERNIMK
jgi:UPF0755 protein